MTVRRVITGETSEEKAIFAAVEEVEPIRAPTGRSFYPIWGIDGPLVLPQSGKSGFDERTPFPPGTGGLRISMIEFPPGDSPKVALEGTGTESDFGASVGRDPDPSTGLMRTDTIDVGVVISGEVVLEQDDGAEVTLRRGDVLVQNGARHGWSNRGTEPCLMAVVVMAADRRKT
jgi:hypothetical protein